MFSKKTNELTKKDIQNVIDAGVNPEGQTVDYKREIGSDDKAKFEILKDIAGFANADSGYLIIGVDEDGGLPTKITGTAAKVGRQKIDEWINSLTGSYIVPKVQYEIGVIKHKDDKVVVVIDVKKSMHGPHMVTYQNKNIYFKRHLDITQPSTHHEVLDMVSQTKSRVDALESYLEKQNLLDESSNDFALTANSNRLVNRNFDPSLKGKKTPLMLVTFTTKNVNDLKTDVLEGEVKDWIFEHARGNWPSERLELFRPHDNSVNINGLSLPTREYGGDEELGYRRYLEIRDNGYIEAGFSRDVIAEYMQRHGESSKPVFRIAPAVAIIQTMMTFAHGFYSKIGHSDQLYIQISVRNAKGLTAGTFDTRSYDGSHTWAEPYTFNFSEPPIVQDYNHFKIVRGFTPLESPPNEVEDELRIIAKQLSRALGDERVKCFGPDGDLDPQRL